MELAKAIIGEQTESVESKHNQAESAQEQSENQPIHPQDLIDAMAEQEFGPPTVECQSSTKVNTGSIKKGKKASGKSVASAPGSVKYGKAGSGNPVKHGKK